MTALAQRSTKITVATRNKKAKMEPSKSKMETGSKVSRLADDNWLRDFRGAGASQQPKITRQGNGPAAQRQHTPSC